MTNILKLEPRKVFAAASIDNATEVTFTEQLM